MIGYNVRMIAYNVRVVGCNVRIIGYNVRMIDYNVRMNGYEGLLNMPCNDETVSTSKNGGLTLFTILYFLLFVSWRVKAAGV